MKIDHLKINGFGKFINKEITFSNGINIVYGLNESGKSTIQKFISGMMFGVSKNKTGKEISEYDKYYPWNGLEYSGKISYTLNNGEAYEIYRDFNKRNPVVYDKNKNDITSKFSVDKNKGCSFFKDQTGIDEKLFLDTAITSQQSVKLDKTSQANIIQRITNILSAGNENISYNKTLEKILKMQNEKIGSQRSSQKPINKVNSSILELEEKQFQLKNVSYELEENKKAERSILDNLEKENKKLSLISDMKEYLDSSKFQFAEVDFNKKLENEYDEKIQGLKNKIDIRAKQNIRLQKKSYIFNYILSILFVLITILIFFIFKNIIYLIPAIILFILNMIYIIISKIRINNKIKEKLKQIDELQSKIDKEIQILKQNKKQKQLETQIKSERLNFSILKNEEKLHEKYHGIIEEKYIENIFAMESEDLYIAQNQALEEISNLKIQLNTLKIQKNNIQERVNSLENLDTNLQLLLKEKENLDSLNISFNLAIEVLQESYKEMKEKVNPNITERLSKMIEKISNGKYKNIIFDDNKGLCVELDNGEYISCEKLSIGTIDEIYLSLRLSSLEEITNEKLPIILDEAFAYFDNERLNNFLEFLKDEYSENQVIIFTCSNREIEGYKKLSYFDYNIINI